MSEVNNAGYATLQIIPSARDFGKLLKDQIKGQLGKLGIDIGDMLGDEAGQKAGKKIGDKVKEHIEDGADEGLANADAKARLRGWAGLQMSIKTAVEKALTKADSDDSKPSKWKKTAAGLKKSLDTVFQTLKSPDVLMKRIGNGIRTEVRNGLSRAFSAAVAVEQFAKRLGSRVKNALESAVQHVLSKVLSVVMNGIGTTIKDTLKVIGAAIGAVFDFASSAAVDFMKNFFSAFQEGMKHVASTAMGAISSAIQGAMSTVATGGLNLLVGALAAIAAALPIAIFTITTGFLALAPVLMLVGGLLGSVFTILAGGVATIGVAVLAFHGLGGAFQELITKGKVTNKTLKGLAPSARSFVLEIEKLLKPLKAVAKFVQGKLFSGMAGELKALAKVWLPALRPMLGGLATSFNVFGKSILNALANKEFVKNIQAGVKGFGGFIVQLGKGLAPFIDMWGRLAKASVPFLSELGKGIAYVFQKLDDWIKSADKTGKLESFMKDAADTLGTIGKIGGNAFGILSDIVKILFPSSKKSGGNALSGINDFLVGIRHWLDNPKNQKKLQDWVKQIDDFLTQLVTVWIPAIANFFINFDNFFAGLDKWKKKVEDFLDPFKTLVGLLQAAGVVPQPSVPDAASSVKGVINALTNSKTGVGQLPGAFHSIGKQAGQGLASGISQGVSSAVAAVIAGAGQIVAGAKKKLKINSPSRVFMEIGGHVASGMAIGITKGTPRVTKAVNGLTSVPNVGGSSSTGASSTGQLVGELHVNAAPGESTKDALGEAMFMLRRISRGGVYAG